jgi:hypothetical protein
LAGCGRPGAAFSTKGTESVKGPTAAACPRPSRTGLGSAGLSWADSRVGRLAVSGACFGSADLLRVGRPCAQVWGEGGEQHAQGTRGHDARPGDGLPVDERGRGGKEMIQKEKGPLPVVEGSRVVTMVTDRDIIARVVAAGQDPSSLRVSDIATKDLVTIGPNQDVEEGPPAAGSAPAGPPAGRGRGRPAGRDHLRGRPAQG